MKYIEYLLVLVYVALVVTGVVEFKLWGQVEYLYNIGVEAVDIIYSGKVYHGHNARYILVYPVYWLSEILGLDRNYIFSIYVLLVVIVSSRLLSLILLQLGGCKRSSAYLLSMGALTGLSLYMNGRIMFSLFAMIFLMFMLLCWHQKINVKPSMALFSSFLILLCASVSSGTFTVVYLTLVFWLFWIVFRSIRRKIIRKEDIRVGGPVFASVLMFSPLLVNYLEKNMEFYDGSLLSMLEHGMGKVFISNDIAYSFLMTFIVITVLIIYFMGFIAYEKYRPVLVPLVISVAGGSFGYSTLVMAFPSIFVLVALLFKKDTYFSSGLCEGRCL